MSKETPGSTEAAPDPVRKISKYILYVVIFLFVWYVIADRYAPWTDQARVKAFVVPIVPQVAGRVTRVNVSQDQIVQPREVLVEIESSDYELAVEVAESELALSGQGIGVDTATVVTAETLLVEARGNLDYVQTQANRIYELEKKGISSKAEADRARAEVESARLGVESAKAEVEKAKAQLGADGQDNPKIQAARAALRKASIDLARTKIYAPSMGGITNLQVDEGHYANPGTPLMTFISAESIWIQANLRENSVANIDPGDSVDISLDVAPGRIFSGKVSSVGFAVDHAENSEVGSLASVKGNSGWLRDAQRFPVIVRFDDDSALGYRRIGGQADVQIYATNNFIVNSLGWVWIRLLGILSFVY